MYHHSTVYSPATDRRCNRRCAMYCVSPGAAKFSLYSGRQRVHSLFFAKDDQSLRSVTVEFQASNTISLEYKLDLTMRRLQHCGPIKPLSVMQPMVKYRDSQGQQGQDSAPNHRAHCDTQVHRFPRMHHSSNTCLAKIMNPSKSN